MYSMFGECKHGEGCEMMHVGTEFRETNNIEGEAEFDDVVMKFHGPPEGQEKVDHGRVTRAFALEGGVFWVARR